MDRRSFAALAALVAGLVGCSRPSPPPAPPPGPNPAEVRSAIDAQLAKVFDAYRRKDGAALAALYTIDGVMHSPDGTLIGRPAIEAEVQKGLASLVSVANDTATTEDFLATDDRAVQSGHIVWNQTSKGRKPVKIRLDFSFTWHKDPDGVWRIQRDINYQTATPVK